MQISDITNIFLFIGGIGMFLFGMNNMSDGMQKCAGASMRNFLGMLTNNRLMAIALGALITAIIQSSGATTVMVVGFVSAGLMNLNQAVGVIMGANIGTTITAWIVSLGQLGDAFAYLRPGFYAPLILGIGAFIYVFSKDQKKQTVGEILIGLGLLFLGLDLMSSSVSPYTDSPIFAEAFALLGGNPILGMLTGAAVTALLQSSSASVGILQTLAMNGIVSVNAAVYITLGQNIGSCVTAIISSLGGSRTAKRAAVIHLTFNVIGAIIVGTLGFVVFSMFPLFAASNINAVQISIFHTVFNLSMTALMFPFANQLVTLSGIIVRGGEDEEVPQEDESLALRHLDERIFESPALAIETAILEIVHMGQIAWKNLDEALHILLNYDFDKIDEVNKAGDTINSMDEMLTEYLVKVNNLSLTERQKKIVNNLFYTISDINRISDHILNLAKNAQYMQEHKLTFSDMGIEDMETIGNSTKEALFYAIQARESGNMDAVRKVTQYNTDVEDQEDDIREKHIERLSNHLCEPSSGVIYLDSLSHLKRISDYSGDIASYVRDEM